MDHYFHLPLYVILIAGSACLLFSLLFSFTRLSFRFRYNWLNGLFLNTLLFFAGAWLTHRHNLRDDPRSITHWYKPPAGVVVTLTESLTEKPHSYKAAATALRLVYPDSMMPVKGTILLYFQKDSCRPALHYGDQLLIAAPLQPIKNPGNPGSFDFQRYFAFRNVFYETFLTPGHWMRLKTHTGSGLERSLLSVRKHMTGILRRYIHGKNATGLSEALLIGYKDDLDKSLRQAFAGAGIIHLIAISGLHLGLIYALLSFLLKPLEKKKRARRLRAIVVISGLWLFSFLAGGSVSVLRSAVIFSLLVVGDCLDRRSPVYNSLAASAFLLLCYNPLWLWDTGFQLSYAAVLSILLFYKPVYNLLFLRQPVLHFLWKSAAVALAAQVLTLPLTIYYFHRFPLLFLPANLLAVPLTGIILAGELLLCSLSFLPAIAAALGACLSVLLSFLAHLAIFVNRLPGAVWTGLQINGWQVVFLYLFLAGITGWLLLKNKTALPAGLVSLLLFTGIRAWSFRQASRQAGIIVYNISRHQAIDFMDGRHCVFRGDSLLQADNTARRFYLTPSRTLHRCRPVDSLPALLQDHFLYRFHHKLIAILDSSLRLPALDPKITADLVICSKNPRLSVDAITRAFDCKCIVADASNTPWQIARWQKRCAQLHVPFYCISASGAFVMKVD